MNALAGMPIAFQRPQMCPSGLSMKLFGNLRRCNRPQWHTSFVAVFLVLVSGSFAAWHLKTWPARLSYPGELDFAGIEGMGLVEMLDLRRGEPIYAPDPSEKFEASNYGPLYYLLGARLVDPQAPAYRPLRWLCLLTTLGCAAGSALLAYWLSGRGLAATLAALLFLSWGVVSRYGVLARCDMPAVTLAFGGFLIAYKLRRGAAQILAVPVMLLSFFYKPQYVAGPIAVLIFLNLEKRYRQAAGFGALLLAGGLAGLLAFQFGVFRDQAFFRHFAVYNQLPFSLREFGLGFAVVGLMCMGLLLGSLEFLYLRRDKLVACYLFSTLAVSLVEFAKEGSGENYFLELVVLSSALFGALMAQSIANLPRAAMLTILLVVTALCGEQFSSRSPSARDWARDQTLQTFLRENFPAHSPALGLFVGDLMRAGLETPVSDLYQYTQLVAKGTFSDSPLVHQIALCRYAVVLLPFDIRDEKALQGRSLVFLSEPVRRAILGSYRLTTEMEMPQPEKRPNATRVYVWTPRCSGRILPVSPTDH